MKISIFGIGYVGAVTAGCLSKRGHTIIGVDVNSQKVELFNQGRAPIVEPGLDELLASAKAKGLLRATVSCDDAIAASEVSIVCVGTPPDPSGSLDLSFVRGVIQQIAASLRQQQKSHVLMIRSTMLPGSTERLVNDLLADLEANGKLRVFYFPEFLREGTAVADFEQPSLVVVGTRDGTIPPKEPMLELFGDNAQVVNWSTAEMVKYACNAFHATKIVFANEIGRIGKELEIDAQAVMALLCRDTKLNLSPYYLRPGNPFGGSCLPKDVRALAHYARDREVSLPLLDSLLASNERHLQSLLETIMQSGQNEIVILGLAFKSNTDDLRESAMVEVARALLEQGRTVRIFDPSVRLEALVGTNKRVVETKLPQLPSILQPSVATALGQRGLIVGAQRCVNITELARYVTKEHRIFDVNGWPELKNLGIPYEGFCW